MVLVVIILSTGIIAEHEVFIKVDQEICAKKLFKAEVVLFTIH